MRFGSKCCSYGIVYTNCSARALLRWNKDECKVLRDFLKWDFAVGWGLSFAAKKWPFQPLRRSFGLLSETFGLQTWDVLSVEGAHFICLANSLSSVHCSPGSGKLYRCTGYIALVAWIFPVGVCNPRLHRELTFLVSLCDVVTAARVFGTFGIRVDEFLNHRLEYYPVVAIATYEFLIESLSFGTGRRVNMVGRL